MIAKKDLIHGAYYKGNCRNAEFARWNGLTEYFYHHRTKFGHTFVEKIRHPEDDTIYDVFEPEIEITSEVKNIDF